MNQFMYKQFFGLKEDPFGLTPNTSLYFGLPPHEEALEVLRTALKSGEGFIKVTGEVGTGKTMVLRLFIDNLPDSYELIYLPNPILNPDELRISIARDLGVVTENRTNLSLNDDINRRLLEFNSASKKVVLVIDEAQALPDDTLEMIRLLGNLETEHCKMIQIVLFGQPELDERLSQKKFRQLRQRISFAYNLRALNQNETAAYLNYRMLTAGYRGRDVFGKKAAKAVPSMVKDAAMDNINLSVESRSLKMHFGLIFGLVVMFIILCSLAVFLSTYRI